MYQSLLLMILLAKVAQVTRVRNGRRSFIILPIILPKTASVNEKETRKRERERGERERGRERETRTKTKVVVDVLHAAHTQNVYKIHFFRVHFYFFARVGPGVCGWVVVWVGQGVGGKSSS